MKLVLDLSEAHQRLLGDLLRQYLPDVEVWAYGSRVKGTARRYSDLDLVAFADDGRGAAVPALREALDESNLPFLVDLHIWDELPESFHVRIREGYVAVQKPMGREEKA